MCEQTNLNIADLFAANEFQEKQISILKDALTSISKNTCCDSCQEASLVAKAALSQLKRKEL